MAEFKIFQKTLEVSTNGFCDCIDITDSIETLLEKSDISTGTITIFIPGATAGVTTIEFESGAVKDLKKAIERIIPENMNYHHDQRWHDGNGFSHVRAAIIGPSITIPVTNNRLTLGTWQQIIIVDFDNKGRNRKYSVSISGV